MQQSISSLGGAGTFNVTAPPRCSWRAASQTTWLTVTGNAQGNGNATVSFSAAPASAPRVGRITVADQTNATGRGLPAAAALRVRGDGSQVYESIARFDMQRNEFVAVPIDLSNANEQVFLILFGTGFRNRLSLNDVSITLGN